jgi:hypothetical protein
MIGSRCVRSSTGRPERGRGDSLDWHLAARPMMATGHVVTDTLPLLPTWSQIHYRTSSRTLDAEGKLQAPQLTTGSTTRPIVHGVW